jgi:tRNA U38,U39,U40 pseudouridine synthase TruA
VTDDVFFANQPATFPYDKNFKFSEELRARINEVLAVFVGTHNFHNYSSGINPNDAEAKRFIMSFAVRCR